jgi:hypothetical protein
MHATLKVLTDLVDEGFDHVSWHGTTLLGSIRGVNAVGAARRPAPRRHNIWELTVHAAYWKYAVRRRLTGDKRGSFACKGSNWFVRPIDAAAESKSERAWKSDVRLLIEEHRKLRETVASLDPRTLSRPIPGKKYSVAYLVRGIAAHDLYHAGQIQLLKKTLGT